MPAQHVRAGAPAAAARQLLAAAPRAGSPDERELLVAVAATQLVLAGAPLGPLAAEIAEFAPSAPRSQVLGREALNHGDLTQAGALFVDAWERATDADPGASTGPRSGGVTVTGARRTRWGWPPSTNGWQARWPTRSPSWHCMIGMASRS